MLHIEKHMKQEGLNSLTIDLAVFQFSLQYAKVAITHNNGTSRCFDKVGVVRFQHVCFNMYQEEFLTAD